MVSELDQWTAEISKEDEKLRNSAPPLLDNVWFILPNATSL